MKYVIPIAIEKADATKLLGALPPTASATRTALAQKIAEIIESYEPTAEKTVETVDSENAATPKKTAKKMAKKSGS